MSKLFSLSLALIVGIGLGMVNRNPVQRQSQALMKQIKTVRAEKIKETKKTLPPEMVFLMVAAKASAHNNVE